MTRTGMILGGFALMVATMAIGARATGHAQSTASAKPETGDAAVAALVAEVRSLRADLAAASRNQLRAQLLLGRVQMQEQRLAYLDKQRSDAGAQLMIQAQITSGLRGRMQGVEAGGCSGVPAEQRRDCEANAGVVKRQLAEQESREQQLRAQENDLINALSAEQARWSDFNSRLDELERALR